MFAASYECTYGTFVRMEFQKTFQAMVTTPINIDDVIAGEIMYGAFKSTLYGIIFLLVTLVLGLVTSPWVILMPFLLALAGLFFAIISIIWTGLVPRIESFNYFFTLIMTPVFLFSGIFFPLSGLPQFIQKIAWFNPLFHAVNLSRGLILGQLGNVLWLDLLWLLVFTILLFPFPIYLMRRLVIK
jgi:lipooligosaccharide transport system permease protein